MSSDSLLSLKVTKFSNVVDKHKTSQSSNPFSSNYDVNSPKTKFSKEEYGKPVAGSLTAIRGQKANKHICREMLELCYIIYSEGYQHTDETPELKLIAFGELFRIYTHINNKLTGLSLRALKHKFVDFNGEILLQRRDDDVPILMVKSICEIKAELNAIIDQSTE